MEGGRNRQGREHARTGALRSLRATDHERRNAGAAELGAVTRRHRLDRRRRPGRRKTLAQGRAAAACGRPRDSRIVRPDKFAPLYLLVGPVGWAKAAKRSCPPYINK